MLLVISYYSLTKCKTVLLKNAEEKQIAEIETFQKVIKTEDPKKTQERLDYFLEGIKKWGEKSRDLDIAVYKLVYKHFKVQFFLSLSWSTGLALFFFIKRRNLFNQRD